MKSKIALFMSSAFILGITICKAGDLEDAIQASYQLEAEKKWMQSLEVLARKYKNYPDDYFLNLRLGWLFRILGNYENAKIHYSKALQINPKALDPQIGLYFLDVENREFLKSKMIANALIPLLIEKNEFEMALKMTNQELQNSPIDLDLLHFKLSCLVKLNKREEAKRVQSQILGIHPQN